MSYTLQRTSDSEEVVSDLESIIGGTRETTRAQSLSSRVRVLAGTTALAAVATVLVVASYSNRPVQETTVSATIALSQDSQIASWDQILLKEAHEIDATWNKLNADQAKFKRTGGWETAHHISEDHERLRMEEADFTTVEVLSKQHADHQREATTNLRATAQSSSTVPVSTTLALQPARPKTENLSALAEEFLAQVQKYNSTSSDRKSLTSIANMLKKAENHIARMPQSNITQHDSLGGSPLVPKEALHDGNRCPEDEEEYPQTGGTCFKKCSDLTGGAFPIRSTAFSCCESEPCGVGNSKIHLNFCGGFDVAGDAEGNGCPSSEGACLKDEELLGGICYKKCSTFEGGDVYHHRVAPNMCCRTTGMSCMLPSYFRFSTKFAIGGGDGDGNSATPDSPHAPIQEITEVTA